MSAPIPDPTRERIRGALLVVGTFAASLGVEPSTRLEPWVPTMGEVRWYSLPAGGHPLGVLHGAESLGWTVLAHWIEQGGNPVERVMRLGGTTTVGWRVSLAGRTWSRAVASLDDHARVAALAEALLILRRWTNPARPWGLRDLQADALERVEREASVRALGPVRVVAGTSPIPASYLAAHGTASE